MNQETTETPRDSTRVMPEAGRAGASGLRVLLSVLALLGCGLLLWVSWQAWETRQQLDAVREEVGRRLLAAEQVAQREQRTDEALLDDSRKMAARLDDIEQQLGESRDQEAALQALYQDVARGREAMEVLEVEQAISLAVQQLHLAGNVPAALLALRAADANLARLDKARYLPLRKALAADISVLMALPLVDVPGISLRLEQLVQGVDKLPLKVYGRPVETIENAPAQVTQAEIPEGMSLDGFLVLLRDAANLAWQELRGMIRIQRFDRAEPALLAPGQEFFLRENLKLRLLSARLALFARDQWTYRNELSVAKTWLADYFHAEAPAVVATLGELEGLLASEIVIELPDLRASQQALLGLRDGRGAP